MSKNKLNSYLNYRMKVTVDDGRVLSGILMGFDKHMNLCIADCEEFRKVGKGKAAKKEGEAPKDVKMEGEGKKVKADEEREEKRALGFIVLRGECIVSMTVEGPPPRGDGKGSRRGGGGGAQAGSGVGRAAGRGIAMPVASAAVGRAPAGLSGPTAGVGAPAPAVMMPQGMSFPGMPPIPPQVLAGMAAAAAGRGLPFPMPPGMTLPAGMPQMPMPPGMARGMPPGMPVMPQLPPGFRGFPPGMMPTVIPGMPQPPPQ